jgi:serine/threonine protein kinase
MYGDNGMIDFPASGKCSMGVAYLVTEHVDGQLLYDVSKNLGKLGESVGLYFLRQIVDVLKCLHK